MSINENILRLEPKIKIEVDINDIGEYIDANKNVDSNIVSYETEQVVEERPVFVCSNCFLTEHYDCYSDHVRFNRNVRTKVNYYLTRDPFCPRNKRQFMILGSVCSMCNKDVCIKPECSIFYSKFFCSICARKHIDNFPTSIQEKIKIKQI